MHGNRRWKTVYVKSSAVKMMMSGNGDGCCQWFAECGTLFCLYFGRPRSKGWLHHGCTFSIYLCISISLTDSSRGSLVKWMISIVNSVDTVTNSISSFPSIVGITMVTVLDAVSTVQLLLGNICPLNDVSSFLCLVGWWWWGWFDCWQVGVKRAGVQKCWEEAWWTCVFITTTVWPAVTAASSAAPCNCL